jgi:F-type H+-transporting ATPase subunit epsilon
MSESSPPRLRLKVITSKRLLVEDEADEVTLPGLDGELGVLPGHRPLITALGRGELAFRRDGRERRFSVEGGTAEVTPDRVLVFTELARDEADGTAQG